MKKQTTALPTTEQLEAELNRIRHRARFQSVLKSTIYSLITVAAIAVLIATLWLPVLQIYGTSMAPTLEKGDIILTVKTSDFKSGDIVAFYYNNKVLVKRVIALSGDWVDIDQNGAVYVNNQLLDEPYIAERALGDIDIKLPYQVPDDRIFVMGDQRETSVDSRNTALGCVAQEQIVGRIFFQVWPLREFGFIRIRNNSA